MFTRTSHRSLTWARRIDSTLFEVILILNILIYSRHIYAHIFHVAYFLQVFRVNLWMRSLCHESSFYSPWFGHPNNTGWRLEKLHVISSCHFLQSLFMSSLLVWTVHIHSSMKYKCLVKLITHMFHHCQTWVRFSVGVTRSRLKVFKILLRICRQIPGLISVFQTSRIYHSLVRQSDLIATCSIHSRERC